MANYSLVNQIITLQRAAKDQNNEDAYEKATSLLQQVASPSLDDQLSREGRIYAEEQRQEQENYNTLLSQSNQINTLLDAARTSDRQDVVSRLLDLKSNVDNKLFDYTDITEEIQGLGIIALESVTAQLASEEVQAKLYSEITGVPYDTALSEYRRVESEFERDHPVAGIATRIAVGLLPTIALSRALGPGATFASGALRQGGLAAAEIAGYSFAEAEGDAASRLEAVGETLTDPLAIGATLVSGGLGGLVGRAQGKALQLEQDINSAIEREAAKVQALRTSAEEGIGTRVIDTVQDSADSAVLNFYNQNGRMPEGLEISQIYRQVSNATDIPINRIFQSELKGGARRTDLDYRGQSIDDVRARVKQNAGEEGFVPASQAKSSRGFLRDFWDDKGKAIVKVARERVSDKFAGNIQRTATNMAQHQQVFDIAFKDVNVQKFAAALEGDASQKIKQHMLNFANSNLDLQIRNNSFDSFKKLLTADQFAGYQSLMKLRAAQAKDYSSFVFRDLPFDPLYWPSRTIEQTKRAQLFNRRNMTKYAHDENLKERTRGFIRESDAIDYENPLIVFQDKLLNDSAVISMHKNFGLANTSNRLLSDDSTTVAKVAEDLSQGRASFRELRNTLEAEGATEEVVDAAEEILSSLIVNGTRGPSSFISNFRKAGYVGTIASPYSALLNFGDIGNTVVNFGLDNTAMSLKNFFSKNNIKVGVEDVGLLNQTTGEFLREGASKWNRRFNQLSDESFKVTGFRSADIIGKETTLNAAINRGRRLAADNKLTEEYNWLFSPVELNALRIDLLKGNKTQRVKEFAAAELGKIQPTDLAQMPKWYLDHPNGRILYMLRTFGLKQLQQIERLVVDTWKEGDKKEAIKNALAYVTVVGGGNAFLNELRQPLRPFSGKDAPFTDEDRIKEYFVDYMLGVATLNTQSAYTLEGLGEGRTEAFFRSFFPAPAGMATDIAADLAALITDRKDFDEIFFEGKSVRWLPFMRDVQPLLEETLD